MDRTNTQEEYRFNERGHVHEILIDGEWKRATGCTTILGVINKPSLISWAANCAVDFIKENSTTIEEVNAHDEAYRSHAEILTEIMQDYVIVHGSTLEDARKAHIKKRDKAGDWGTQVHAMVEDIIKNSIKENGGFINEYRVTLGDELFTKPVNHFIKWAIDNKVRFLESEKGVYSKSKFIAGIIDIICEIDGKIWLADIKTGSGIYAEAFFQMGGYDIMLEEMGHPEISGYLVLNLKKDGTFDEKRSISNEDNRLAFMSALSLYRIQEKIKNNIL